MKPANFQQLIDHILTLKERSEMIDFLRGILTRRELDEITQRLQIVRMLKLGVPQRKIADKLGVGVATVTRGSKELQKGRFKNVKVKQL